MQTQTQRHRTKRQSQRQIHRHAETQRQTGRHRHTDRHTGIDRDTDDCLVLGSLLYLLMGIQQPFIHIMVFVDGDSAPIHPKTVIF